MHSGSEILQPFSSKFLWRGSRSQPAELGCLQLWHCLLQVNTKMTTRLTRRKRTWETVTIDKPRARRNIFKTPERSQTDGRPSRRAAFNAALAFISEQCRAVQNTRFIEAEESVVTGELQWLRETFWRLRDESVVDTEEHLSRLECFRENSDTTVEAASDSPVNHKTFAHSIRFPRTSTEKDHISGAAVHIFNSERITELHADARAQHTVCVAHRNALKAIGNEPRAMVKVIDGVKKLARSLETENRTLRKLIAALLRRDE